MLRAQKYAAGQDGERVVPVLGVKLGQRPEGAADAGVVDHAVEPSEFLAGVAEDALDVRLLGDVGVEELAAELRAALRVQIGDDDRPVRRAQPLDRRAADPACPARDDCDAHFASRSRSSAAIRSALGIHASSSAGE